MKRLGGRRQHPTPQQDHPHIRLPATKVIDRPKPPTRLSLPLATVSAACFLLMGLRGLLGVGKPHNTNTFIGHVKEPLQNITVILMNHARPRNLQKSSLLPTLLEHSQIPQVLLLHSNPSTAFHYSHPKVQNINASTENQSMGLSLRFWFCAEAASHPWVLQVDDDMLIPPETLQALMAEFSHNPKRIVGVFGRQVSYFQKEGLFAAGYNTANTHGSSEVVLTKLMLMEQSLCQAFHAYAPLVKDLVEESHPYWNGEDIFMSLVANHVYAGPSNTTLQRQGMNNYAMPWLPVEDVGDAFYQNEVESAISANVEDFRPWDALWWNALCKAFSHLRFRGTFWQRAKRRLAR